MPFDNNHFDLVCAFDVIEHVADDLKAMSEMKRVSKQNGVLFITVPAFMFLWSHHDDVNHHYRRYTLSQLKLLSSSNKLKVEFNSYFNFFLFFPIAFYRLSISRIFKTRKGAGSDFEINSKSRFLNDIFFKIFKFEEKIITRSKLPVGVSIISVLRKVTSSGQ